MRRRAIEGQGVYGVKLFDFARPLGHHEVPENEAGIDADVAARTTHARHSNRTVAVFVVDVRTHKTPWRAGPGRFGADLSGDFLGDRQWQWFERSLKRSSAAVTVVVSGLQVHAERFPDGNIAESWSLFPTAQERLFSNLLSVEAPIIISGDVHMTQLMRKDCTRGQEKRSLIEMTTRYERC